MNNIKREPKRPGEAIPSKRFKMRKIIQKSSPTLNNSASPHIDLSYNHKTTEILEVVRSLAAVQTSVFQEIAAIHEKLNTILQKFDDCIEVEDRSVEPEENTPLNSYFETYEDESEDQQEDDNQQEEEEVADEEELDATEVEAEEEPEIQSEQQIIHHQIKNESHENAEEDGLIHIMYEEVKASKRPQFDHYEQTDETEYGMQEYEEYTNDEDIYEIANSTIVHQSPIKTKRQGPRKKCAEKYIPKLERRNSQYNEWHQADDRLLMQFPVKHIEHLDEIERRLRDNSAEDWYGFKDLLINKIGQYLPQIKDLQKVSNEISKSALRQMITDDVMQYFCWTNKFPKQYPFLLEMKKYLFFNEILFEAWKEIFYDTQSFEDSMKKVIRGTRIRFHLNRRRSNARIINKSIKDEIKIKYVEDDCVESVGIEI